MWLSACYFDKDIGNLVVGKINLIFSDKCVG